MVIHSEPSRQMPEDIQGNTEQKEQKEQEISVVIPDLSGIQPLLLEHQLTRGRRGLGIYEDDASDEQKEYYRLINKLSSSPGESSVAVLAVLIEVMKRKGVKGLSRLKPGGSICEIGGPTPRSSEGDVKISGAKKIVIADPGHFDTSSAIQDLGKVGVEKQFETVHAEDLAAITKRHGLFDYVTSYRVFGSESRVSWVHDAYLGPDLSTREKRMHLLRQVAAVLKKGGVFLIETCSSVQISAPQFGLSQEQRKKMASRFSDPSFLDQVNFRVHGFDFEEFEEAGFVPITQLGYQDVFVLQKK